MTHRVLSRRELNRATLARQYLLSRHSIEPLAAVEHLGGLQAQAPFSPYYQLWSRLEGFRPDALAGLLLERRVVRMVTMRGTVHLHSVRDALGFRPAVQQLMSRDLATNTTHAPALRGIDQDALADAARKILADSALTNAELGARLAETFPECHPSSLAYAARNLLALVQVPPRAVWGRSGQPRLTTVESWTGRELRYPAPVDEMVLRYLGAFGPATVADVQTWCGLTRLKEVLERLRPGVVTFRDEHGRELFDLPDAARPDSETPAPPRFLPDFDNVLRSHADRSRVVSETARTVLNTRNGVSPHALLVDGTVAATWRIARSAGAATLMVEPLRALDPVSLDAVVAEGERLLAFAEDQADSRTVIIADHQRSGTR